MRLITTTFGELDKIQRQIEQVFEEVAGSGTPYAQLSYGQPPVELRETEETLLLRALLPGIDSNDLDIQATREVVLIAGKYSYEAPTDKSAYFRSEFPRGHFRRVISLPLPIQNTEIKADYQHGILTLTLPKAPEVINKAVKVSVLEPRDSESPETETANDSKASAS